MNHTIRTMRWIDWVGFWVAVAFVGAAGLVACGDDDTVEREDANRAWFVTTDPYGQEFACIVVTNGSYAGGGLFCHKVAP